MNQHSKDRKREHEPHGWEKSTPNVNHIQIDHRLHDKIFMRCPCGWFGWVDESVLE